MEFTSSNERNRVKSTLDQIRTAIAQLKEWNEGVNSADDYSRSNRLFFGNPLVSISASTYILGLTKKMKHMKHFLTAVLLAAALPLMAQPIDRATALKKAQTLLNDKSITFNQEQELRRTSAYEVEPYYIFNGDKGQGCSE